MRYCDDMKSKVLSPQIFIYALYHPSSPHMYIGQTSRGMHRPRSHFLESVLKKTAREARSKWIKALRARGDEPLIAILEVCASVDDLDEAERFHIAYLKSLGVSLLNHTDGGGGMRGYQYTEERMRVHVEAMKRLAAEDPNYSERMSEISKAQWTEEKRKKKSEAMKGQENISPEARAKQAAALRGKPKSAEHKAALSEAKRLKWQDPEYRAKQVAAQRAAHGTPEKRAQAAEWAKLASHDTHRTEEYRKKQSEVQKEIAKRPERQQKRIEVTIRLWENDEYREKVVDSITDAQQQRREREKALKEYDHHKAAWDEVVRDYMTHETHKVEVAT